MNGSVTAPPHPLETAVLSAPSATASCPPVASARALMRRGLAPLFQDPADGLVMRFVQALEQVLDPRVAVIDSLPAYLAYDLAPQDMVGELLGWLGFEAVGLRPEARRRVLANARTLALARGTRAGLALALRCAFPELHFRVVDSGGTVAAATADHPPTVDPGAPWLLIRFREKLEPEQREVITRIVERHCPVYVAARVLDEDFSMPAGPDV
jgi:phage tail-like protein